MAQLIEYADLTHLNTFKLPAKARYLYTLTDPSAVEQSPWPTDDVLILGGGSNTLFLSDWPGTVVVNAIGGIKAKPQGDHVLVSVGAGVSWHDFVKHCLDRGWYGLENLIMIPGSVGAAPIQNIGAYGVELAACVSEVTAWDRTDHQWVRFDQAACQFGYRDSVFKHTANSRYLITEVTFQLNTRFEAHTNYPSLQQALMEKCGRLDCAPKTLAATIMQLRRHRLPDPHRLANAGSFFKNPLVGVKDHDRLKRDFPDLPTWPMDDTTPTSHYKLSAGWMIDQLGFRGRRIGDAGVYPHHALVLVNWGHATGEQVIALVNEIKGRVLERFGVELEPEPQLIDSGHQALSR